MSVEFLSTLPIGLLPVLMFLVALLWLDSYKLVPLKTVLAVIAAGALTLVAAYFANGALLGLTQVDWTTFTRYLAPVVEEFLKALVVVVLFRRNQVGFLVDSAILGFAVGAGFSLVENVYYLYSLQDTNLGIWIVRGFGTAIMHGGVTAIFAILAQIFTERRMHLNPLAFLPGFAAAVLLHSVFNHFVLPPLLMTLTVLLTLPPLLWVVFQRSARHMHEWLELDFDEDAHLLRQIKSGEFQETRVGRFLHDLKTRFDGPVVVDMLCYLRVYTELALRAKGVLLMRENGLDVDVGERTREKFVELEYLEKSIGPTGLLAMSPFLHMTRKDLWQLYVING